MAPGGGHRPVDGDHGVRLFLPQEHGANVPVRNGKRRGLPRRNWGHWKVALGHVFRLCAVLFQHRGTAALEPVIRIVPRLLRLLRLANFRLHDRPEFRPPQAFLVSFTLRGRKGPLFVPPWPPADAFRIGPPRHIPHDYRIPRIMHVWFSRKRPLVRFLIGHPAP